MPDKRIEAIDIMRGLTLVLMLFVNDLFAEKVPAWLTHRPADFDGMGLADWVFPGFLFMVGMAIPFAFNSRINRGELKWKLLYHICMRTISLLLIGVLMLNVGRLNSDLTGMSKFLWAILVYTCIFLIWNNYNKNQELLIWLLKGVGIVGLIILVAVFRSGTADKIGWIATSWWGILGLIGWGYFVTSLVYIIAKDNLLITGLFWLLFVLLNVVSQLNMLEVLKPVKPVLGIILEGNVPSIVLSGLLLSLILRRLKEKYKLFIIVAFLLGVAYLIMGFIFRNWFIISKINGTPSWAMMCNGISVLLFVLLYIVVDVYKKTRWAFIFSIAGRNSLTTYLAPNIIYYSIWWSGVSFLFYKQSENLIMLIGGSVLWSVLMVYFTYGLFKINIRLKLQVQFCCSFSYLNSLILS